MDSIMKKIKAVAGAVSSLVAVIAFIWLDKSVSLDEINQLWLAIIPVLVALGVWASPKNKEA